MFDGANIQYALKGIGKEREKKLNPRTVHTVILMEMLAAGWFYVHEIHLPIDATLPLIATYASSIKRFTDLEKCTWHFRMFDDSKHAFSGQPNGCNILFIC